MPQLCYFGVREEWAFSALDSAKTWNYMVFLIHLLFGNARDHRQEPIRCRMRTPVLPPITQITCSGCVYIHGLSAVGTQWRGQNDYLWQHLGFSGRVWSHCSMPVSHGLWKITNSAEECCWVLVHLVENHRIKTRDSGVGSLAYHLLLVIPGQNCSVSHLCLAFSSVIWWVYLYLPQRGILKMKWHNPHKVGNRMPYCLENTHWLVATLIFLTLNFSLHISKFRLQLPKNISLRSVYNMLSSCIRWLHKKRSGGYSLWTALL